MSRFFISYTRFKKIALCGIFNKFDPFADAMTVHFNGKSVTMTVLTEDTYDSFMYRAYSFFKQKWQESQPKKIETNETTNSYYKRQPCPFAEDSKDAMIWDECDRDY